ncbi:MAG: histidine phosphatase family protein [Tabrizicola sp.]|nr:histidine phosphatase family protein [Tabrizicola sp.]
MTRLWWVRHAPTHSRAFAGWRDIAADLSDTASLARLDAYLPKAALLTSSDLVRATATADALAPGRDRLPPLPALREFDFGDWDGLGFDEVARRWPDLSRAYWEKPGHIAPPNGESWWQAEARISSAADALVAANPGRDIIAVAHFGAILTQLARAKEIAPEQVLAQRIDNLSVTCLCCTGPRWTVSAVNHIP